MALNLQQKGFAVTGWNRTAEKGQPLVAAGGRLAASLQEAVAGAEAVVSMLADPAAVEAVALGPGGFLAACEPGTVWLECSTIGPSAAQRLAAAAAECGVRFVDAPVLGSLAPAREGTLVFLAGGAEADVEQVRPLMNAMGSAVRHMGPAGAGAGAKVISNMVTATLLAAVGEGLALGEKLGLNREQVAEMLAGGPAGGPIVKGKALLMVSESFSPAFFQLRLMEKDMGLALAEALKAGAPLPTVAGAHSAFAGARVAGMGDMDFAAVAGYIRQLAKGPMQR
jgi:3-hydroxyisobutyrate dehydrogenase-like beta-hydroxyacid dehydrogenase